MAGANFLLITRLFYAKKWPAKRRKLRLMQWD